MEEKDIKQIIAKNICELRKAHKLTQVELAEKLNYSDKAISRWERGDTLPDIDILIKICNMFGVDFNYLISEETKQKQEKFASKLEIGNRLTLCLLAISIVWLAATTIYVYSSIISYEKCWQIFVWAVPATAFVSIVTNAIWGKKAYSPFLETALVWTLLTAIFITFLTYRMWMIFIIGIPIEIIIVLLYNLRRKKK